MKLFSEAPRWREATRTLFSQPRPEQREAHGWARSLPPPEDSPQGLFTKETSAYRLILPPSSPARQDVRPHRCHPQNGCRGNSTGKGTQRGAQRRCHLANSTPRANLAEKWVHSRTFSSLDERSVVTDLPQTLNLFQTDFQGHRLSQQIRRAQGLGRCPTSSPTLPFPGFRVGPSWW